jgi:hypothetical protein
LSGCLCRNIACCHFLSLTDEIEALRQDEII